MISDAPKTLVYRLARAVNAEPPVIPESTLTKPPSAELRPDQTDQDSLPPYDLLDAILEAHLVDGLDGPALVARGFAPPSSPTSSAACARASTSAGRCRPASRSRARPSARAGGSRSRAPAESA